ncbi:ABC transporter ATP-binding protein [Pseudonocardia ailaonensis]|uniref:ABC transporter ATP-binding protein n=1 Tax=Pseudonocardia ailaonensis TaxID=367279 RepID=A0ABN2NGV1_9PSEU
MSVDQVPVQAPAETAVPVLRVDDLAVHYGGIKAVDGVSFEVAPGELVGLIGPNGSGKSTLLAAVSRLTTLTRGALWLDGGRYESVQPCGPARLGIGRTFQTVRVLEEQTVRQNIQLGADLGARKAAPTTSSPLRLFGGLRRKGGSDTVDEVLERTGLQDVASVLVDELPYGLRRRVEIARALATRPRLLLLDEPLAGMTSEERADVAALVRQLHGEGLAQILVEHDVDFIVKTCPRLIALDQGKVIAEGAPADVVADDRVRTAYLGVDDDDAA